MIQNRKVIRVFLASPGDLKEEREAAKRAVDELNQTWLPQNGYHVELVGWELTVAALGRPQALINQDLESCAYFIGVVWKRWGTPPAKDGGYQSGFEEEFEISLKRFRATGAPEISLYFKSVASQDSLDPGPQLQKVVEFKNRITADQTLLYEEFVDAADFEARVRKGIFAYVRTLMTHDAEADAQAFQQTGPEPAPNPSPVTKPAGSAAPALGKGAQFLKAFADRVATSEENLNPVEISRFRLLGSVLSIDGDDPLLPVHDANRLFAAADNIDFGAPEIRSLLASGLASYQHENIPVWRWFSENGDADTLLWQSVGGRSDAIKVGALEAMRDMAQPIVKDELLSREAIVENWLAEKNAADNRLAALRYLADHGLPQDLKQITVEFERKDSQTASVAADAILRIALREGRSQALNFLLELQPDAVEASLISAVFDPPTGLLAEDLHRALSHRNASVRAASLKILAAQDDLADDEASALLTDPDLDLRLQTMKHLTSKGTHFSAEEQQRHLVIKGRPTGFFRFGASLQTRVPDFERWSLENMPDDDLGKQQKPFNIDAALVLCQRRFPQQRTWLQQAVGESFQGRWAADLQAMSQTTGMSDTLMAELRKSEPTVRRSMTRSGVDTLCRLGDGGDLALVRRLMDEATLDYSTDEVEFIRKNGEWEDVARLLAAVERPATGSSGNSLLNFSGIGVAERQYAETARAMIALGRDRVEELLALKMPEGLRRRLIRDLPENAVAGLSDSAHLTLFAIDDAGVRKSAALRAVRALSRKRIHALLTQYQQQAYRYYNVIMWLDLGVSLPRPTARATAERVLRRSRR